MKREWVIYLSVLSRKFLVIRTKKYKLCARIKNKAVYRPADSSRIFLKAGKVPGLWCKEIKEFLMCANELKCEKEIVGSLNKILNAIYLKKSRKHYEMRCIHGMEQNLFQVSQKETRNSILTYIYGI